MSEKLHSLLKAIGIVANKSSCSLVPFFLDRDESLTGDKTKRRGTPLLRSNCQVVSQVGAVTQSWKDQTAAKGQENQTLCLGKAKSVVSEALLRRKQNSQIDTQARGTVLFLLGVCAPSHGQEPIFNRNLHLHCYSQQILVLIRNQRKAVKKNVGSVWKEGGEWPMDIYIWVAREYLDPGAELEQNSL